MCKKNRDRMVRNLPHAASTDRFRVPRRAFLALAAALPWACRKPAPFPPADVPEGAYARITMALYDGRYPDVFPYLEDEAQWAAHTIQKERARALARAKTSFPAQELAALEAELGPDARAADGVDVFVRIAKSKGWFTRLRRDLSGVARVEREGDRATLVTARGTRHPMRRRTVGLWGLTAFTADLADAAEKATRDRARIEEAAHDYDAAAPTSPTLIEGGGDAGAPG